jgi:hypothetical protein
VRALPFSVAALELCFGELDRARACFPVCERELALDSIVAIALVLPERYRYPNIRAVHVEHIPRDVRTRQRGSRDGRDRIVRRTELDASVTSLRTLSPLLLFTRTWYVLVSSCSLTRARMVGRQRCTNDRSSVAALMSTIQLFW